MNEDYGLVAQVEASERDPEYCGETRACCLLHHRRVFWQAIWSCWVHSTGLHPCEALAGEPDPDLLPCRYCGARLQVDGAGRLWSLVPEEDRHPYWEKWTVYGRLPPREHYRWHADAWTGKCAISPTFRHEVRALRFTGVKQIG